MPHKLYLKIFPPNTSTLSNPALAGRIGLVFLGMNGLGIALAHLWSFDRVIFNLDYLLVGLEYVW